MCGIFDLIWGVYYVYGSHVLYVGMFFFSSVSLIGKLKKASINIGECELTYTAIKLIMHEYSLKMHFPTGNITTASQSNPDQGSNICHDGSHHQHFMITRSIELTESTYANF